MAVGARRESKCGQCRTGPARGRSSRGVKARTLTMTAVIAFLMPLLLGAISPMGVAGGARSVMVRHLGASGGTEEFSASVVGATRCSWESVPRIAGFPKSLRCGPGIVSRSVRFKMNYSAGVASWRVTLTVFGAQERVLRWQVSEAAPSITYSASVSSDVVQNPANPFEATYSYSADAIATAGYRSSDLAEIGKLPNGVLQLLSGGSAACSMDVGGRATGGDCTIDYSTLGQHFVTARYEPEIATVNAPFETAAATIGAYSTSTAENIVKDGSSQVVSMGNSTEYEATYTVTAETVDQYGYAVALSNGSWTFELSGLADDGNTFQTTITPPPGQVSCVITIEATLTDDYTSQSSSVSSPDCSGGLDTGNAGEPPTRPGNNVPGWFVTTEFTSSSAGFSGSSSGGQDIVCEE